MPVTGRGRFHAPRGGSVHRLAAVAAACLFGLPVALLPASTAGPPPVSPEAAMAVRPLAAQHDADRGAVLYYRDCSGCHGQRGTGTTQGPPIAEVGAASVDFQLSTGRMPLASPHDTTRRSDPTYPPEDIDALVRFVAGFGGGPPIPKVESGDISTGQALYLANCAACHSATGAGGTLSGGRTAPGLGRATAIQVAEAIRVGPGPMPVYPESVLDDGDVDAIVAYVEVLQNKRQDLDLGGLALGRVGPLYEGAVGLAVTALLLVVLARWLAKREPGEGGG